MPRPLFRTSFRTVFVYGFGATMATAVSTVPSMTAMTEHMHRDHPGEEQQPNPIL